MSTPRLTAEERAEIRRRLDAAQVKLAALCHGERWNMSIPVREDEDSDTVIGAALRGGYALLAECDRLEAAVQQLSTPDMFGLVGNNDTATPDIDDLANELCDGEIAEVWANRLLGDRYLVRLPDPDDADCSIGVVFGSLAEAEAAVAAQHSTSNERGEG